VEAIKTITEMCLQQVH